MRCLIHTEIMVLLKYLAKNVTRSEILNSKIILLDHQNNYVGHSSKMMSNAKSFDNLATSSNILHNYQHNYFQT